MDVAKPQLFNGTSSKVLSFIIGCKLYIRNKLAGATVKEQVQWVLSHMQGEAVDVWKENMMEELESGEVEYEFVEELLTSLKREFGGRSSKGSRVEEAGAGRKNDGGICAGV